MKSITIILFLVILYLYIFNIEYIVNENSFPFYSVVSIAALAFGLTVFVGFVGEIIIWQWRLLSKKSLMLKIFTYLVFPYVLLTWLFKFNYKLIISVEGAVIWLIVLYIILALQRKRLHQLFADKRLDKKGDIGKLIPDSGIDSLLNISPLFLIIVFFIAITFAFKDTIFFLN